MDQDNGTPGGARKVTMGLSGWAGQMANLTAVGLICLMFWRGQEAQLQQARDDRSMFTQELIAGHDDARSNRIAIQHLTRSVEQLADEVRLLKEKKP